MCPSFDLATAQLKRNVHTREHGSLVFSSDVGMKSLWPLLETFLIIVHHVEQIWCQLTIWVERERDRMKPSLLAFELLDKNPSLRSAFVTFVILWQFLGRCTCFTFNLKLLASRLTLVYIFQYNSQPMSILSSYSRFLLCHVSIEIAWET